jgi:hypothetical protein
VASKYPFEKERDIDKKFETHTIFSTYGGIMNRVSYLKIVLFCVVLSTTYAKPYNQDDVNNYLRIRREKHQEYVQKYPDKSEAQRYMQFLQDNYPTHNIKAMFERDTGAAIKIANLLWENNIVWERIVACDWEIHYPSESTQEPSSLAITRKTAIVAISSIIGLPLVIGICYKLARYAQQKYRKQVTKNDYTADTLQ